MTHADLVSLRAFLERVVPRGQAEETELVRLLAVVDASLVKPKRASLRRQIDS